MHSPDRERAKLNPPQSIPYRGVRNFVGRTEELASLHQKLQAGNRVSICAVAGMGGVGKTELAIQYARTHEADYPGGICWLNARDTNLATEIIQFAQLYLNLEVPQKDWQERLLTLTEQVRWCWQKWQPPEGLVLVVLDDVTDLASCREVLPTANRFRVLVTTRLQRLDTNFVELPLGLLSREAALELLTALEGEGRVERDAQTAEQLCGWLGYLPLGLELVGRYLAEDPDLSLTQMLERLKAQRLQDEAIDLDEQQMQNTCSTAPRGVRAAFELSWQELEPVTQRVAQYLSLYTPTVFLWEWVESDTKLLNCSESDINAAKKQLYKHHLIGRVEEREGGYKIHPLIREFLQAKLAASQHKDKFRQAFAVVFVGIAQKIPESPTRKDIELVKEAIPHLEEVAQNLTDALADDDLIWPFVGLSRFYEGQGLYKLAEPWRKQCLEQSQRLLGEEHPDVALSLSTLAGLYYYQGRYDQAEPLYVQALELRKRLLGEEHLDVALSLNNLAELYRSQGRYSQAEPLYVQVLVLRKRLLGEDHLDVALSLNNLAVLYYYQRRYDQAEPLFLQVLELRKRLLREDHLDVALSLNNLAALYKSQGHYDQAELLYLQALAMRKRLLGEEHSLVASSLNNLAELYDSQRRYDEAELLYLQALAMRKRLLGEEHPDVARNLNNLAVLYDSQGRYDEAEPLYLQALAVRKCLLGEEHPDVARSLNNLAVLYDSQGHYDEAEPLYLQAVAVSERVLGVNHPDTVLYRKNLAVLRQKRSTDNF